MIAVSNSSPLIVLSSIDRLDILSQLFITVYIPEAVYQETVVENHVVEQRDRIAEATDDILQVMSPTLHHSFTRKLGAGEYGVLNLALEMHPDIILLDDKKARNEAREFGLTPVFTADILKWAEQQQYIHSYTSIIHQLALQQIYLPE